MKKAITTLSLINVSFLLFSQVLIYEDDFEHYNPGKFPPTNWHAWHNCVNNPSRNIVTNTLSDSSNVLQVYGAHNGGCWSATATYLLNSLPQKMQVEAYLRASGEAGTGSCGHSDIGLALLHKTQASTGYGFIDIRFSDDRNIYLRIRGETTKNIQPYNINQWYHVKFELDVTNFTFTSWIDDVSYGPYSWSSSNLPYQLSEYRGVSFTSDDGKGWGDNLKIYDYSATSKPYFPVSKELSIYPNPIINGLTVISNFNESCLLNIFNSFGQQVFTEIISTNNGTVNTSGLDRGIYFIVIKDLRGKTLLSEKILKE